MTSHAPELVARPYRDDDLAATLQLLEAVRAVDPHEDAMTAERWQVELREPGFDPERDLRLWLDRDGRLAAIGALFFPPSDARQGYLWLRVDPTRPAAQVVPPILGWAAQRLAEEQHARRQPLSLRTSISAQHLALIEVVAQHGFRAVRTFYRMARPLDQPIPAPVLPAGFRLTHSAGSADAERWLDLFNQSFIDHYNHRPWTIAESRHAMEDPGYAPERDLIAIAPDGTWAGFCRCLIDPAENRITGRDEGWIRMLGTRRGFRRIGLGRALLLAGLHTLRDAGATTALLGVDAENPSGAVGLYESVGFQVVQRTINYLKET
ncbi:GNAT family N-acetyltransferase [Kallotenue papyrolyticum]|uniref:GNAT family N-acetyltransferase n=1 Tax=Kallotenue papyrolyticum TaxID=1325125 RepID=UPI0004929A1D|nr:GNAT family N-acetyltransferase [Kallotenue papyrolyticum]